MEATFVWVRQPADLSSTVLRDMRGFAIVLDGRSWLSKAGGDIMTLARGVPPPWVNSMEGAVLYPLQIDHLSVLQATSANRSLKLICCWVGLWHLVRKPADSTAEDVG